MRFIELIYLACFQLMALVFESGARNYEPISDFVTRDITNQIFFKISISAFFLGLALALRPSFRILIARMAFLRARIDGLAGFEGVWVFRCEHPPRPYAVGVIQYNPDDAATDYYGAAFDQDLKVKAKWHNNHIVYLSKYKSIIFFGRGELTGKGTRFRGDVLGNFHHGPGSKASLRGYVCDVGNWTGDSNESFEITHMRHLDKRKVLKLIGKYWPETDEEFCAIINHALQEKMIPAAALIPDGSAVA